MESRIYGTEPFARLNRRKEDRKLLVAGGNLGRMPTCENRGYTACAQLYTIPHIADVSREETTQSVGARIAENKFKPSGGKKKEKRRQENRLLHM